MTVISEQVEAAFESVTAVEVVEAVVHAAVVVDDGNDVAAAAAALGAACEPLDGIHQDMGESHLHDHRLGPN